MGKRISDKFKAWQDTCNQRFYQLKANEEELNRIFIQIYGLQNEISPIVDDKDVSVNKADLNREIKSLISYAVGCMFGRYSLDADGICCAGNPFEDCFTLPQNQKTDIHHERYYLKTIACQNTFDPNQHFGAIADNIIPITDDDYFANDIVHLFTEFIRIAYGQDTLEENLYFIANALGGKGSPWDTLRTYFLKEFYSDHVKIYQKRPIYWLFTSGKKNAFQCLIYMHRYRPDTIARIRTDYVHELQSRYHTAMTTIASHLQSLTGNEAIKRQKQLKQLQDQNAELINFEEKLHHYADQMMPIDLDDGVKTNYAKLNEILAPIKPGFSS